MPATQRGQVDRIKPGHWRLRYYLPDGGRTSRQPFASKSAAWAYFREHVEPELRGEPVPLPELTLAAFVPLYLDRHGASVRPRTIATLAERLRAATRAFGDVPLRDLARMADEVAGWAARQPPGARYGRVGALRQTLDAAVSWRYMDANPAKLAGRNRQPAPRTVRVFTRAELDAIAAELPACYQPLPAFAAATGLRPGEWMALERRDIDRRAGILTVRRTVSSGEIVELAKTNRSLRQVPLSPRATEALDAIPARLDTMLLFPTITGLVLRASNFYADMWAPSIEASGVRRPARIYDLRSTFASNAIAARISLFELAKVMGTSVAMIERAYGTLLDGAGAGISSRLAAFEAEQDRAAETFGSLPGRDA